MHPVANSPLINQITDRFQREDVQLVANELRSKKLNTSIIYHSDAVPLRSQQSWLYQVVGIVKQIAWGILGTIIFPLGLYWIAKAIAASALFPVVLKSNYAHHRAEASCNSGGLDPRVGRLSHRIQRFVVAVEGWMIDSYVVSPGVETLRNRRWTLVAGGNSNPAECIALEACAPNGNLQRNLAESLGTNMLFFDYPGVVASEGPLNMELMGKVYRAMLQLVTDKDNGFGANRVLEFRSSMGGGVGAKGSMGYHYSEGVRHVVIDFGVYSSLVAEVKNYAGPFLGALAKQWGWDVDVVAASRELIGKQIPEIILYSNADQIVKPNVSLAHAVESLATLENKKAVLYLNQGQHIGVEAKAHIATPFAGVVQLLARLVRVYMEESAEDPRALIHEIINYQVI